jgi:hypothetical protein
MIITIYIKIFLVVYIFDYIVCFVADNREGTLPTLAEFYINAHTKKGGGYANPEIEERVVCYSIKPGLLFV